MAHSRLFDSLMRIMRLGSYCNDKGVTAGSATARLAEMKDRAARQHVPRRSILGGIAAVGAGAAASFALPRAFAAPSAPSNARVAIIGGGIAGMTCADRLREMGVVPVIYEAHATRLGGRIYSNRMFPGQVAENGGELIDNWHKVVLGYANEFNLGREDLGKAPGESSFYFFGQHYAEADVVDEYRILEARMRLDVQQLSAAPTFRNHTSVDVTYDHTSMADYLADRAYDLPLIEAVLNEAYVAEYGRELSEQSCLNLLYFITLNRSSNFKEFGGSDERYHLVGGNDGIIQGIRARLPGPIVMGARLTALRRTAGGQYGMTFAGSSTEEFADAVVLAIPFSVLRNVSLDPSLGISSELRNGINTLGYGYNAKTMIGFNSRPWALQGRSGTCYSDLANVQNVWETNPFAAVGHAILTDYSGGTRGEALQLAVGGVPSSCGSCHIGAPSARVINDGLIQTQVAAHLADLELVYPGVQAAATRGADGSFMVSRAHWLAQNTSRGSYTCYLPGQFTTVCGVEAQRTGQLYIAGEHADSFYGYQGFMEGGARSGIRAANEVLHSMKQGYL